MPRASTFQELMGRYEYKDGKSDKFWTIEFDSMSGEYEASWGKNGYDAQGTKLYSEAEAYKKIHEKIAKGYRQIGKATRAHRANERARMGTMTIEPKKPKVKSVNFLAELKKL